jgi:hypothetical protein
MDDFGIAAAGFRADLAVALEHQNLATVSRQGTRACKSDDACADDDAIDPFSH